MADTNGKTNKELLQDLTLAFGKFRDQYSLDMHGDGKIDGERGLIEEVQRIKDHQRDYPSFKWYMVHKTVPTVALVLTILISFEILNRLNLVGTLAGLLGITLP